MCVCVCMSLCVCVRAQQYSAQLDEVRCVCVMLTHLQVFVEEAQLAKVLQIVVLFPAAVQTVRVITGTSAHPPVL